MQGHGRIKEESTTYREGNDSNVYSSEKMESFMKANMSNVDASINFMPGSGSMQV